MEFQKVLETRRTVRKYSAGVTREQMEELLRAAQEAPSWKNSQTGRYYCCLLYTSILYQSARLNASCTAFMALTPSFSLIRTVTRISEVEIILMFTPSL